MATFGSVIASGQDHRVVFDVLAPGIDPSGDPPGWERSANDLYPDAVPTIRTLADRGIRVGVAGNQAVATEGFLAGLGLPIELVATSAGWGVSKPDPRFFTRIADELDLPPAAIAYVGDRLDNDVLQATSVGMNGVLIRRGPWGITVDTQAARAAASLVVTSLTDILDELG
jgi:FMN phosphatase YigB (HAD superfamily)